MNNFLLFLILTMTLSLKSIANEKVILDKGSHSIIATIEDYSTDKTEVTLSFRGFTYNARKFYKLTNLIQCKNFDGQLYSNGERVLARDEDEIIRTGTIQSIPCEGYVTIFYDNDFLVDVNRIYNTNQFKYIKDLGINF